MSCEADAAQEVSVYLLVDYSFLSNVHNDAKPLGLATVRWINLVVRT